MPWYHPLFFPVRIELASVMIRGGFSCWPRKTRRTMENCREKYTLLNTRFDFLFFFQFVPRFHPRISFPFSLPPPLSLSLFNLFSFAIERCYSAELRSIVKIIFQFGADWLPFNLTRFHCRTSLFARNMHTHLPILLDDFNFIEKKEKS